MIDYTNEDYLYFRFMQTALVTFLKRESGKPQTLPTEELRQDAAEYFYKDKRRRFGSSLVKAHVPPALNSVGHREKINMMLDAFIYTEKAIEANAKGDRAPDGLPERPSDEDIEATVDYFNSMNIRYPVPPGTKRQESLERQSIIIAGHPPTEIDPEEMKFEETAVEHVYYKHLKVALDSWLHYKLKAERSLLPPPPQPTRDEVLSAMNYFSLPGNEYDGGQTVTANRPARKSWKEQVEKKRKEEYRYYVKIVLDSWLAERVAEGAIGDPQYCDGPIPKRPGTIEKAGAIKYFLVQRHSYFGGDWPDPDADEGFDSDLEAAPESIFGGYDDEHAHHMKVAVTYFLRAMNTSRSRLPAVTNAQIEEAFRYLEFGGGSFITDDLGKELGLASLESIQMASCCKKKCKGVTEGTVNVPVTKEGDPLVFFVLENGKVIALDSTWTVGELAGLGLSIKQRVV